MHALRVSSPDLAATKIGEYQFGMLSEVPQRIGSHPLYWRSAPGVLAAIWPAIVLTSSALLIGCQLDFAAP